MTRRPRASLVANPVLVGAVTTLVVIVAVFLSYNANNGLPFVPTHEYKALMSNGSNLVKGNEVREGGFRIGVVTDLKPITLHDGRTVAQVTMKLDQKHGVLPANTSLLIRPRSALGLKYIQLDKGSAKTNLHDGDTIPLKQTHVPVQIDDLNKLFDRKTRAAAQKDLVGFGDAFAGRGQSLNQTIAKLPELFRYLTPVARNLSSQQTQLGRFFKELGDAARIVAPIADVNAQLFTDMGTTFKAIIHGQPLDLENTIQKSPSTLAAGTDSMRVQTPFLNDTADFSTDLRGAIHSLRGALPQLNPALEIGTPTLKKSVAQNKELQQVLDEANKLVRSPTTLPALRGLTDTVGILNPTLRFIGPYQTVCNYWNYFWTYLGEHISEGDPSGTAQRATANSNPSRTSLNSLGNEGAWEPNNGEGYNAALEGGQGDQSTLHGQAYGAAIDNKGNADCENGQRGYLAGPLAVFANKNDLEGNPTRIVFDPHTPGNQGKSYVGRNHVPKGETFQREPTAPGATLDPALTTGIYSGNQTTLTPRGRP